MSLAFKNNNKKMVQQTSQDAVKCQNCAAVCLLLSEMKI